MKHFATDTKDFNAAERIGTAVKGSFSGFFKIAWTNAFSMADEIWDGNRLLFSADSEQLIAVTLVATFSMYISLIRFEL